MATLFGELHPLHFVYCFRCFIFMDRAIMVSDHWPLPVLIGVDGLHLLLLPHVRPQVAFLCAVVRSIVGSFRDGSGILA